MYHALVYRKGVWASHGLHIRSPQWTAVLNGLKRTYAEKNVAFTFWPDNLPRFTVYEIDERAEQEVTLANEAQKRWDAGTLPQAADNRGKLDLRKGIEYLRAAT
jgi:hypothetical protein